MADDDEQSNVFNINRSGDDQLHRAAIDLYDDIVTEYVDYDEHDGELDAIDYEGYAAACIKYLRRFAHDRPDWYVGATGRHPSHGVSDGR